MLHDREDYNERVQDSENKIPEKEPVFLMRGQDQAAVDAVSYYASRVIQLGGSREIAASALRQSARMQEWPVKKIPDLPKIDLAPAQHEDPPIHDAINQESLGQPGEEGSGSGAPLYSGTSKDLKEASGIPSDVNPKGPDNLAAGSHGEDDISSPDMAGKETEEAGQ